MERVFRYSLQALLKKRGWELESARLDELEAREAKIQQQECFDAQAAVVTAAETELRDGNAPDRQIHAERYQALIVFLQDQRQLLSEEQERLEVASRKHAESIEQLTAARRSLRALERHRDAREEEFRLEQERDAIRVSDELWLLRREAKRS